jgi:hypothetical protein
VACSVRQQDSAGDSVIGQIKDQAGSVMASPSRL